MSHEATVTRARPPSRAGISRYRAALSRLFPLLVGAYVVGVASQGDLRIEHVVLLVAVLSLSLVGPRARAFLNDISPYVLVGMGYDLVRYARAVWVTPDRVTSCGLRNFELATFSVAPGVTLQDWFQVHHAAFFDLLFAVPYTVFVYVAFGYAAYLYFKDRAQMRLYLWAFTIANYVSFSVWLLFPAAPPWYVRAHGCLADMSVLPSAAGLLRVDQLLGIHYYEAFYSRTASVFGAMPSMHCAYPMLGLLTSFRRSGWFVRSLHIAYAITMFVASNYLDHHWAWDGLAGIALAAGAVFGARRLLPPEAVSEADGPALNAEAA